METEGQQVPEKTVQILQIRLNWAKGKKIKPTFVQSPTQRDF
jgi:hypothetical protein